MINFIKNLNLSIKISLIGAGSVLITAVALVILAVWQSGVYNKLAQKEVNVLIDDNIDNIANGVYNLVYTENEAVQQQVNYNLQVARRIFKNVGKVSLSNNKVKWNAINQYTKEATQVEIPQMLTDGKEVGSITANDYGNKIVDEVTELVGETATIFQRMNKKGDMLRISTTVKNEDNKRALGTYIPAINPDGLPNPVVTAIMNNKTYHGRAYVVNEWYLTAYEAIKDNKGNIIGMLYGGIKQKNVESRLRNAILNTKVGKTGYVYVINGTGEKRGYYIISQHGIRDGENIWESKDTDGNYIIKTIVNKALKLKQGELETVRYRWQNPGEPHPRWKIARLTYFSPWDWVIGTSVYEDELQNYYVILENGRNKMITIMGLAGLFIILLVGLTSIGFAWTITRPLKQITKTAEIISTGNFDQFADIHSTGEIGKLAQTFNFMTQQLKITLEGLRNSEAFLNKIVENIPDMIFVKETTEGRFVRFNKAGENLLGYNREEMLGKTDYDIFPEEVAAFFTTKDKVVIESKVPLDIHEEKILTKNLGTRILHTQKIPLLDDSGNPKFILGISEDITEIKKAEEALHKLNEELEHRVIERTKQLESANKELKDFAFIVSHDLKAPLRAVSQLAHWLKEDYYEKLDEEGKETIDIILRRVKRMDSLIDGILHYSRVGRLSEKREKVNILSLVNEVVSSLIIPSNIKIYVEGEFPTIIGDQTQFKQVFQNLVSNSVKFMDKPEGIIKINCDSLADQWKFSLSDNGPGIEEKYFEKVFQIFQTLSSRDSHESTGIGLTIVKKIVELYGGDVHIESEINNGTTIIFTIPKTE